MNENQIQFSIVIPCFNEEKNIPVFLEKFRDCLDKLNDSQLVNQNNFELILVDNGSIDNTNPLLHQIVPRYPFCSFIHTPSNLGYGGGIDLGLSHAKGEFIGWTHADLQADPADVIVAFGMCPLDNNELYFIKGRRRNRPLPDRIFSRGMSIFESVLFMDRYDDINAQPNIFSRQLYDNAKNIPNDFSFDLYFYYLASRLNYNIKRFDVLFPDRIHGTSTWNTGFRSKLKFIKRTISYSIQLKKTIPL